MLNQIIASLITLGLLNPVKMNSEEKIKNASWMKVAFYFVLTVITLIVFYKTYQVATIKTNMSVYGLRGAMQQTPAGETIVGDSVELLFFNHFTKERRRHKDNSDKSGGSAYTLSFRHDAAFTVESFAPYTGRRQETGVEGMPTQGHLYSVVHESSFIPMLFPFYRTISPMTQPVEKKSAADGGTIYTQKESFPLQRHHADSSLTGKNWYRYRGTIGYVADGGKATAATEERASMEFSDKNINTMNFFTAADLSQCTYEIRLTSDCPIRRFNIEFDIPAELSPLDFTTDSLNAFGFAVTDQATLNKFTSANAHDATQVMRFHAKFPSLANMQLIRSLILTTVLTALVSLLLSSLYCRMKKHYTNLSEAQKQKISSMVDIQTRNKGVFRLVNYLWIVLFSYVVIKLWQRVLNDTPILVEARWWPLCCVGLVVAFLLLCVAVLYVNRKIIDRFKKKK